MCITPVTIYQLTLIGHTSQGSFSVPGVKAGDRILVINESNGNQVTVFEPYISTNDYLYQTIGSDLSYLTYNVVLVRAA